MKRKFISLVLALTLTFTGATCLAGCGESDETLAYVSLDINPGIELIVDNNNKVVSVRGENEDGLVLLYEETGIVGEKIDVAVKKITDLAIEYGYLDENNKVVDTIVTSENEKLANRVLDKVNVSITATAENSGLTVTTSVDGAYSLIRKMDEFKAKFPNNTAIQNMSVSKFKLALSVSETGEISLETAVLLDDAELIKTLKNASAKIEAYATKVYLEEKAKAVAIFDKAVEIPSYAVYTQYYLENLTSHLSTAYYGGVYQMYATSAKTFEMVCDMVELATEIYNYKLSETEIAEIIIALGMEPGEIDKLKDSNGDITIESIEAYADKLFKNTPASEALEQTKKALTTALNKTEAVVKEKVQAEVNKYKDQIEQAKATAESIFNSVSLTLNMLPTNVKAFLNEVKTELTEILNTMDRVIVDGNVNVEELRKLTDRLDDKAQEYLTKIKNDLTAEEFEALETKRNEKIAEKTAEKQAFEQAISKAENTAKTYLQNLKQSRKANNG